MDVKLRCCRLVSVGCDLTSITITVMDRLDDSGEMHTNMAYTCMYRVFYIIWDVDMTETIRSQLMKLSRLHVEQYKN